MRSGKHSVETLLEVFFLFWSGKHSVVALLEVVFWFLHGGVVGEVSSRDPVACLRHRNADSPPTSGRASSTSSGGPAYAAWVGPSTVLAPRPCVWHFWAKVTMQGVFMGSVFLLNTRL